MISILQSIKAAGALQADLECCDADECDGRAAPGAPDQPPAADAGDGEPGSAAQDFEAMALGALLAPMFATVDSAHGPIGGGEGGGGVAADDADRKWPSPWPRTAAWGWPCR